MKISLKNTEGPKENKFLPKKYNRPLKLTTEERNQPSQALLRFQVESV